MGEIKAQAAKYGWDLDQRPDFSKNERVKALPLAAIRRPLQGVRSNGTFKI